jgi:DNA processing protein
METDLLYQLALSRVPGIGPASARQLLIRFGTAKAVFLASPSSLEKAGIGVKRARALALFNDFRGVEKELVFLEKFKIRCLFLTDKDYPQRLLSTARSPILLYYKGKADLNAPRILAIVGTRTPTEYGKQSTERLVKELAFAGLLVISGLAYGIDATAHRAALRNALPTIGVLGHGLDRIYPSEHRELAREMLAEGGLLTEFRIGTEPDPHHFPVRNRIVAGMSDALLVAETDPRGGSMLTVGNALACNRRVFAFPGRITDNKSAGCNSLIQQGKARLLTDSGQLLTEMKWARNPPAPVPTAGVSHVPGPLSAEEQGVLQLLKEKGPLPIDTIAMLVDKRTHMLAVPLLNLELQGLISVLPGRIYRLEQ